MFEHFRQFFANERNRTAILLIIGLLIFVAVLKHFGLYEGFGNNISSMQDDNQRLPHLR
jgi:Na+/H+ antiporter NhaD/arsenite permease-like protein